MSQTENIFAGAKKHVIGRRLTMEQLAAYLTMEVIDENTSIEVERGDLSSDQGMQGKSLEERLNMVGYGIDGREHSGDFLTILLKVESAYTSPDPITEEEFRVNTLQLQNLITTARQTKINTRVN